jgi:hypothetical protein
MGDMLADAFRRRAFGFTFQALPQAGRFLGLARQEASDRRPLHVAERGGHLLVIPHVDLGTRFLGAPTQRTERREFIARLHQGLDPHVDQIGENVLALGGLKYRPHEDTTTPFATGVDVQIRPNQRAVPPAIAVRLILPEEVVPVGRAHDLREMGHQTRWERLKGWEVAQALKRFEQDDHPQGRHGGGGDLRHKCHLLGCRGVELPQFFVRQIGAQPWIRRLVNGGHRGPIAGVAAGAKSILYARYQASGYQRGNPWQSTARTDAKINVRLVDRDDEFSHYTGDSLLVQRGAWRWLNWSMPTKSAMRA